MRALALATVIVLLIGGGGAHGQTTAEVCAQLRALNAKYRGVKLDDKQKADKVQMRAFYDANCRSRWKGRSAR